MRLGGSLRYVFGLPCFLLAPKIQRYMARRLSALCFWPALLSSCSINSTIYGKAALCVMFLTCLAFYSLLKFNDMRQGGCLRYVFYLPCPLLASWFLNDKVFLFLILLLLCTVNSLLHSLHGIFPSPFSAWYISFSILCMVYFLLHSLPGLSATVCHLYNPSFSLYDKC